MSDTSYLDLAIEFCRRVVVDEVVTGRLTRLACQRQLTDLDREDFPYYFDEDAANRPCAFLETLPHIEGEWASRGELIRLEPWQCFLITTLFGWRQNDTELRRFRSSYWEVGRKNAKTTIAAGLLLYLLAEDGEAGAKIFSAATKRDQAKIVFDLAREMLLRCKARGVPWAADVGAHLHSLFVRKTASSARALDAQGKRQDGLNAHAVVNDELHAWEKRQLYDVLKSAMGARQQPLMLNITTAGFNYAGVCYDLRTYGLKVLERTIADETFFPAIWTLDPADDPWDTANWPKANPNWGISVYPLGMEAEARSAKEMPGEQAGFLTKRLNIWCNAEQAWMQMLAWEQCADRTLKLADFAGEPCWLGVDLASKRDLAALAIVFRRDAGVKRHWYAFVRHYLPEHAVLASANAGHYDGWVRAKHLTVTPGNILDVDLIEHEVFELVKTHQVQEVAYDPGHNSTQFGMHIASEGITAVEVRPTVLNFSDPMKWWEAYVLEGTFHHTGCPVLTWEVSNVCVKRDQKDNIFPRKDHAERKIDGPVAVIMAMNRALAADAPWDVYNTRGVITA